MGDRKKRKLRFLASNPICCYCGGSAETEDHCPARICFKNRIGPEGWSFPSCGACNKAISATEQIVAFYIRSLDFTDENYCDNDIQKLYRGLNNNFPDLLPNLNLSSNAKRRAIENIGLHRPKGVFLEDVPLIGVPDGIHKHLNFFCRKLTAAIYFKYNKTILDDKFYIFGRWLQSNDHKLETILSTLQSAWSDKEIGTRSNMNFGDQLSVVVARSDSQPALSYIVQFGTSLCFWGGAALLEGKSDISWERYRPIKEGL